MSDLRRWLKTIGLEEYVERFEANRIDADVLTDIVEDDLEKLDIPLGDRKRLLKAIALLREEGDATAEGPAPIPEDRAPQEASEAEASDGRVEWRQLSVMFADLVNSTALSQRLDLEDYRALIRAYHESCVAVLRTHRGFIAQFQGDGVLAYFGYPRAGEDDAERAAAAGLAIIGAVGDMEAEPGTPLQGRVGVATGLVAVGDLIGEGLAEKWAATGETPNLAARLQELAAPDTVVACDVTRGLLGGQFVCDDLGLNTLKGFADPVRAWRVKEQQHTTSRFESRQRGSLTPFVGRGEEIELLSRRWEAASEGNGQVVLISGEPGIGKSRLTKSFCDQAVPEPHTRLRYQCSPNQTGSPLHPVIAQLEQAIGFAVGDGQTSKFEKLETWVRQVLGGSDEAVKVFAKLLSVRMDDRYGPLELEPRDFKDAAFRLLLEQLAELLKKGPMILIVEDLHWIDPTTQEFLDVLVEQTGKRQLFLICTCRPDYKAPWIGDASVTYLNLRRLDGRQSADLLRNLLGGMGLPVELVAEILAKTDGVPLFLEELTKATLESGSLRREGRVYTLDPEHDGLHLMPTTLLGSLLARLDRLPGAQKVAPIGAAIGRTFSYALLREVVDLGEEELQSVLAQLIEAQLLSKRGHLSDSTYKFKHALVQDAAYGTLPKGRRRVVHRRIATALAESFSGIAANNPEIVADHFTRSDVPGEAFEFWRRAAILARQRSANVEAINHIRHALAANEREKDIDARVSNEIELREMLIVPLEVACWGSLEIPDNLDKLRKLREARGDTEELLSVLHAISSDHIINGRVSGGRNFARKMFEVSNGKEAAVAPVLASRCLGFCEFLAANFKDALAHFERTIALSAQVEPEELRKHYYANSVLVSRAMIAWTLVLSGRMTEAEEAIQEVADLAEREADIHSKTYALCILASVHQSAGNPTAAQDYASRALDLSQQHNTSYWEAWAQIMKGWALSVSGSPNPGIASLTDGIAKYEATGSRQMLPYARTLLADAYCRAGHVSEGLKIIDDLEGAREFKEVRFVEVLTERIRSQASTSPQSKSLKRRNGGKD